MKKYDINDFKIEIIKKIEYDNDVDLKKEERILQDENKEILLNKNRAYITYEECKLMKRQITKQFFIMVIFHIMIIWNFSWNLQ